MRVSIGTAHLLGLKKIKTDALPLTAYLMCGQGCRNNCQFCAQAVGSTTDSQMLSRVIWPEFSSEEILKGLKENYQLGLVKRCCIQVVDDGQNLELFEEIEKLASTKIPICLSKNVAEISEIQKLFDLGAERVTIALDAANPEIYRQIKGGVFQRRWNFLLKAAETFPGRIGTHIIVGLGETEDELVKLISDLAEFKILVALFAFTPLKGTALENHPQPDVKTYRRIQIAHYLIREQGYRYSDFKFTNARLTGVSRQRSRVLKTLLDGQAFLTSGCPDCNRPYYNERPGGVIYNYPRQLSLQEISQALFAAQLWSGEEIFLVLKEAGMKDVDRKEVSKK